MQEKENIERLEIAVRRLLATVDALRKQNGELLARLHDADSGREESEAEVERLRAERGELLDRVDRLIAEIDQHTAAAEEEQETGSPSQGSLGLSA